MSKGKCDILLDESGSGPYVLFLSLNYSKRAFPFIGGFVDVSQYVFFIGAKASSTASSIVS